MVLTKETLNTKPGSNIYGGKGNFFLSMVGFLKLKHGAHVEDPQWIISSLIWTVQLQKKKKKKLVPQDH